MRVVFLGSPEFAVPSLTALAHDPEIDIPLVITQPDRPAGRGRNLRVPPVKAISVGLELDVMQPESIRSSEVLQALEFAKPDVLVVVAYGEFLPRSVREVAEAGAINVHPSLLPRYRGAAPVQAAILNGDELTGVTFIHLEREMDAGPILAQHEVQIQPDDTSEQLMSRIAEIAGDMLPEILRLWINGEIEPEPQDSSRATFAKEWSRDDARIDWTQDAVQIERLVRAAQPWPVAWTTFAGNDLRILRAEVSDHVGTSGSGAVEKAGKQVLVGTGEGWIHLIEVQPPGKRPMEALSWWNGISKKQVVFD